MPGRVVLVTGAASGIGAATAAAFLDLGDQVWAAIVYLAGPGASYVDGTGLPADGGLLSRPVIR